MSIAAISACAACSKPAAITSTGVPSEGGKVGYVRMSELVKHHPLYSQLTGYDESIEALNLRAVVPDIAKPDASLAKAEAALQAELQTAAEHSRHVLSAKSKQYQAREQQAIALALRSSGQAAPSTDVIAQQIDRTAAVQSAGVAAQADRDFTTYRKTLVQQDDAQLHAAQAAIAGRAERLYRAKQDELGAAESALSLTQANRDAAMRLTLRTRLSSLALDDAQRDDARNELASLDRKEADTLGAMKNRDAQTLAALATQLRADVQREMRTKADALRARAVTELTTRQNELRHEFSGGSMASLIAPRAGDTAGKPLSPQLRSTLKTLHDAYQQQFNADARTTIAEFNRTRDDLRRRYEELRGIDASAQQGATAQIAALVRKRAELYGEMVEQIGREVRLLAQTRGISVVVTDPVGNGGGVDLTSDAVKDIESLHE